MKHIGKRLSFYKSKMIVEQIGKNEHYKKIQRVICVCITSKPVFPGVKEYLNQFRFYNKGKRAMLSGHTGRDIHA